MRSAMLAAALLVPVGALAQPTQVPAIQASASAVASAGVTAPPVAQPAASGRPAVVPEGMPPPVHLMAPSAPLNPKEKASAAMAGAWRNHNDKPSRGEDGVLRWVFGASLPSVVCAPLQVCDIGLQPGEVVNNISIGDKARWEILPAVSGSGLERTTHLIVKAHDAGLITSMLVFTNQRTYSIKLVSTQAQWTPLTGFSYGDDAKAAWAEYGARVEPAGGGKRRSFGGAGGPDIDFDYTIYGDASWRPIRVYASEGKTYIQFPQTMQYGSAPALIGLANDGGWFRDPSEQMVTYRVVGDRYVVDRVLEHAELVTGVGRGQTKVELRRHH